MVIVTLATALAAVAPRLWGLLPQGRVARLCGPLDGNKVLIMAEVLHTATSRHTSTKPTQIQTRY